MCVYLFPLISFLPANVNRKTFKTSVKPGWYYFGRRMVRAHAWVVSIYQWWCPPMLFIYCCHYSKGHWRFWVDDVVFHLQRAHPVCSVGSRAVRQDLLHAGSTGAPHRLFKWLRCCVRMSAAQRPQVSWSEENFEPLRDEVEETLWGCGVIGNTCSVAFDILCHNVFLQHCTAAFYIISWTADDKWDQVGGKRLSESPREDDYRLKGKQIEFQLYSRIISVSLD